MDFRKLAGQASATGDADELSGDAVHRFGELVGKMVAEQVRADRMAAIAEEREACAKTIEALDRYDRPITCVETSVAVAQIKTCADVIRERSNV